MTNVAVTVLKAVCSVVSLCLYLSPILRLRRVVRNKTTGETPLLPLVTMFCNYHCWMLHGVFIGDYFPLAATTSIGFTLGLVYTGVFIFYSPDRGQAFKVFAIAAGILCLIDLYALLAWQGVIFHQSNVQIGDVLGYFAVVATFAFFSSPLATIRKVLRSKSSESLIIQMVVMATSNNLLWSTYAAIVRNFFLLVPNSICFCFGLLEIYLCFKYPNDKIQQQQSTKVVMELDTKATTLEMKAPDEALDGELSSKYAVVSSPRPTTE